MSKILFIEDNIETQEIVKEVLYDQQIDLCSTIKDGAINLRRVNYDVVILDLSLPDGSAHDLMRNMQTELSNSSVLILTAKDHFSEKELSFSLGALDYLQKPFNPKELRLRVLAHLNKRKNMSIDSNIFKIGNLICNLEEQKIYADSLNNEPTELTTHEFRIFRILTKEPNKIFSRNDLLEKIWGTTVAVTPRTIDVHVSNLRKKLQGTNVEIVSKQGSGYLIRLSNS